VYRGILDATVTPPAASIEVLGVIVERFYPRGRIRKMWKPVSEQEILAAIEAGNLIENATFDAKAALPDKGKSKDLAKEFASLEMRCKESASSAERGRNTRRSVSSVGVLPAGTLCSSISTSPVEVTRSSTYPAMLPSIEARRTH
jgi:hypothetical protein